MSEGAVKKQAKGVCKEISEKDGWTTFHIDVGRQYPLRLQTKLEAIVKQGREAGNNEAVWTFEESQGGENPNRPGQHYINRRLEKAEVGASLDPALASGSSGGTGGGSGGGGGQARDEATNISIERQVILKSVFASERKFENDAELFAFLDRLDDWMGRDRPIAPAAVVPVATPAAAAPAAESYPDDDIPF